MSKEQVKAFKAPSPIIILVCVILFCALASYVIPAGVYERMYTPVKWSLTLLPSIM